jgi:hypothetical protein
MDRDLSFFVWSIRRVECVPITLFIKPKIKPAFIMKKIWILWLTLSLSVLAKTQDTLPGNKKITPGKGQKGKTDYLLKIDGVNGESPDTLPPVPGHFNITAGGALSQTRNTNLIERYAVQSKPGFSISIGYTWELPKSRLQFSAGYQKGGVRVAVGDIDGDGRNNTTHVDLDYITVPVQYQLYTGKRKRFFMGAGIYVSYLVSSKQSGIPVYENGLKKTDVGCMASAGFWLNSKLVLQTGYNIGCVDIDLSGANKARNGLAFIMLSYSFFSGVKYGPVITIKPKG